MGKRSKRRRKSNKKISYFIFFLILLFSSLVILERNKHLIYRVIYSYDQKSRPYNYYVNYFNNFSVFGIDVSLYQGKIDWLQLTTKQQIDFVFIRATAGVDKVDYKFYNNWGHAKKYNILRGAYHYYRPNENSSQQADNFINTVNLEKGDLPPVLDIEEYSKVQSIRSLKSGLLNWLNIVENHYGITPILYTYNKFYVNLFFNDSRFDKYTIWLAWYNVNKNPNEVLKHWSFWQFTDRGTVKGIDGYIDINIFNGNIDDLNKLCL
jgi:lysozyme